MNHVMRKCVAVCRSVLQCGEDTLEPGMRHDTCVVTHDSFPEQGNL